MKRLQEETMTKMAVLGRGSMRDKQKVSQGEGGREPDGTLQFVFIFRTSTLYQVHSPLPPMFCGSKSGMAFVKQLEKCPVGEKRSKQRKKGRQEYLWGLLAWLVAWCCPEGERKVAWLLILVSRLTSMREASKREEGRKEGKSGDGK